jgi:protein-S-isoprenylcysteine O-methyltransferase Ste14
MDFVLSIATLFLFALWRIYWLITEKKADREKPRTKERPPFFSTVRITRHGLWIVGVLIVIQLFFNIPILSIDTNLPIQEIGFLLVVLGLGLCIVARKQLDTNWANAWEYQIKKKHELVTRGVYAYIRHPIYTGIVTAVIGAELVAESYLSIIFFSFFLVSYAQAKKEEKILEEHFGKEYQQYRKRSKMLIPFVF